MAKQYKALMLPIELHDLIKEAAKKADNISMIELIEFLLAEKAEQEFKEKVS